MRNKPLFLAGLASVSFLFVKAPIVQAHGDHSMFSDHVHASSANEINSYSTPYIVIEKDSRNQINADFNRNPFIGAECNPVNTGFLNCDSLNIVMDNFLAKGIDNAGVEIFSGTTTATFQPSQGVYQDIVTLSQTGGSFDAFEFLIPPEATTTFHSHYQGVEMFYVLGGDPDNNDNPNVSNNNDVIFQLNSDVDGVFNVADPFNPFSVLYDSEIEINGVAVTKGSFVALPAGKIHTWANTGTIPARILAVLTPAGVSNGFNLIGAEAGIFDPSPEIHPILERDGENNCLSTGNGTEVNCQVPEDQQFYDFVDQVITQPDALDTLGFTPFPSSLAGATCPVVYGVTAIGTSAFKISPTDTQGGTLVQQFPTAGSAAMGDDCDANAVPASATPFDGSIYDNPFDLLTTGQNDGVLNPNPLNVNLFSLLDGESIFDNSEFNNLFRVLEGEVTFNLNGLNQIIGAGESLYVAEGFDFGISAIGSDAQIIRIAATPTASSSVPENTPILAMGLMGIYLGIASRKRK